MSEFNKESLLGRIRKTGHRYFLTNMEECEGSDNCATCDGAQCNNCKTMYEVEDYKNDKLIYYGQDKEKAIALAGYDFTFGR